MNRAIDIDELWRVAARKLRISARPPQDVYVEGLRCLASALQVAGRYDKVAIRALARETFVRILADFSFLSDLVTYPEIFDIPVRRPLLITGFGRTGSTLLHNLMALDPNARAPLLWELWTPSPPPRLDPAATDSRIEFARRRLGMFTEADPLIRQIHQMAARAPDECHWMMRHSTLTPMIYHVPEYWVWLKQLNVDELKELYSHYRLQIQHLQLFNRGEHWVSKSLTHLHFMPVLFDVFPDANVVRLHRNPCDAVPSLCSLGSRYRKLFATQVDHNEIGTTLLDMFVDNMKRAMAAPPGNAAQIIDIRFDDLVANPIAAVRSIYARFGYSYSPAFQQKMLCYLQNDRAAEKPRHAYTLDQFGLSRNEVIDRSSEYLAWVQTRCGELGEAARTG
jgi:hypothetical protein